MVDNAQVGLLERQQQIEALIAYAADAARSQGRFVLVAGANTPTHGVEVTGEALQRGIESLRAHAQYTSGLGRGSFDPAPFLTWFAAQGGAALGVESAVLFDLHWIIPAGPPPWVTAADEQSLA